MWQSPISYEAKEFAKIIRESLEKLGYVFIRDNATKAYSRFVIMLPMMGGAHVFKYVVEYPARFDIELYDTYPSTKPGLIPMMEISNIDNNNMDVVKKLLDEAVSKVERPPWEFTKGQRLMVGFLLPEFGAARKAWKQLGYDTSKKTSRERRKKEKEQRKENKKKKSVETSKEIAENLEEEEIKVDTDDQIARDPVLKDKGNEDPEGKCGDIDLKYKSLN